MIRFVSVSIVFLIFSLASLCAKTPQNQPHNSAKTTDNKENPTQHLSILNPSSSPNRNEESSDIPQSHQEEVSINRRVMEFTGVLAVVAILQFFALVWQVRTGEKQLRAYLGISKIFLDISNPLLPIGRVEIQNFGQTPALKVRQWVGICPHSYPLSISLPKAPIADGSLSVIWPGAPHANIVPLKKYLPDGTEFGNPGITIYVYGEITYRDIFGSKRTTSYKFFYGGPEKLTRVKSPDGAIWGAMNPYTSGNDAN